MNSIKVLVLSVLFSSAFFTANASNINPTEAAQALQQQVKELVIDSEVWSKEDIGTELRVKFMVMDNNEIIVLSTNNEKYDDSMKSILNYQEISVDDSIKNRVFILPIRLSN